MIRFFKTFIINCELFCFFYINFVLINSNAGEISIINLK